MNLLFEKSEAQKTIEENQTKTFGWAREMCFAYDLKYNQLWWKWLQIIEKGVYQKGDPVPYVNISAAPNREIYKQLERCYQPLRERGYYQYEFINWIGFALGIAWFQKPNIPDSIDSFLAENFPFEEVIKYPADYFSQFLAENGSSNVLSYFPTPMTVSQALNLMIEVDGEEDWTHSVMDPTVGPGSLVLPTKSLNIVAIDLSPLMVRAAAINSFFYKPQLLYVPKPIIGIHVDPNEKRVHKYYEFKTDTRIYLGNSLLGELQTVSSIFKEESPQVDIMVHPLDLKKREVYSLKHLMEKDWETLSQAERWKLVKAMSREHKFDRVLSNPPFSAKLSKSEREEFRTIEESNKEFLKELNHRNAHMKELEQEVEIKVGTQLTLF
jgi:hypothetical protein